MSQTPKTLDALDLTHETDPSLDSRGETDFRELLDDENITIQRVTIPPGCTEDAHWHDADTYIYHLQGRVEVKFMDPDGNTVTHHPEMGDLLKIPAYVIHEPSVISGDPVETVAMRVGDDVETTYH
jgi:uncharacterized RmlC-like cupin family protein